MISGIKYMQRNWFYTKYKKHYCPKCGNKLIVRKKSRIVNSKSPEAKNFDFQLNDGWANGNVKFIWNELYCPICSIYYTIDEIKRIEVINKTKL